MRYTLFVLAFIFSFNISQSQVLKTTTWDFSTSKTEVKVGETVELIFKPEIIKEWYLYSSDFDPNLGPTVTTFNFEPNSTYELVGKVKAINPKKKYDDIWGGEYTYFVGKGEFRQKVKILKENPKIPVTINYQTCTDKDGKCIPYDEEFTFEKIKVAKETTTPKEKEVKEDKGSGQISPSPEPTGQKLGRLEQLEKEKESLIKRNSKGEDITLKFLKNFVKKTGGV